MATTIEQLELEIQSNSTSAVSSLDSLAASLNKLKSAVKGTQIKSFSNSMASLSSSLNSLDSSQFGKLNEFANAILSLKKITGIKISGTIAKEINNIDTALQSLSAENASKLSGLASGLSGLNGNITLSSKIAKEITNIGIAVAGVDASNVAKIETIGKSLSGLSINNKISSKVATEITNLGTALKTITDEDITRLNKIASALTSISASSGGVTSGLQSVKNTVKGVTSTNTKSTRSFMSLSKMALGAFSAIKSVGSQLSDFIHASTQYTEDLNLFTASMGNYAAEAQEYANTVSDIMGLDSGEWMRNQGVFNTIIEGFGVASDKAYLMSQNLTQLGYDISSFYNTDVETAMQKLQSGIAGELEPLRRLGYDLSVARLQQEAYNLGIEESVSNMTQAEKSQLRYYAIMTQCTTVQGDMARTLTAPANQLRVLKAELTQCARAIGNVFIPMLNMILPYAIAVVKVIRAIADVIAGLFGFELPEINYSGVASATSTLADDTGVIDDNLSGAAKSAKKMKDYMLGIDELNVINPNDDSSGSGSGANSGYSGGDLGIDLPTYDFLEGAVQTKVNAIVDKMKEWLGITGEISSWADFFKTRLGKIVAVVGIIGAGFAAWKIGKSVANGIGAVRSAIGMFGGGKSAVSAATGETKSFKLPSVKTVLKGLAELAIIVGGVVALIEALGLVMKIPGAKETAEQGCEMLKIVFKGIGSVILPLTAISAGIIAMGKFVKPTEVVKGFADFAIIVGGIELLVTAIGAFLSLPGGTGILNTGLSSLVSTFTALEQIAIPLAGLSAIIVGLGFVSPAIVVEGFLGFAVIVGGLEVLLAALGGLNQIPGFSWIIGEGGKVLMQLGDILGGFAGSIVNGFLTQSSKAFPEMGANLADFMNNAQPFFTGLSGIDSGTVNAAKAIAEVMLILTAADLLKGLTSWLTGGKESMSDFGAELEKFAPSFVSFAEQVKDIDGAKVEAVANSAKAMAAFAQNIPNSGGVAGFFAGENDIGVWGEQLEAFGGHFAKFASSVANVNADVVTTATEAAQTISAFAKEIPNSGGLVGLITGNNDIDTFGAKLASFAPKYVEYASTLSTATSVSGITTEIRSTISMVKSVLGVNSAAVIAFGAAIKSMSKDFKDAAQNIIAGFANQIKANYSAAKTAVISWANNVKTYFTGASYGAVNKTTFAKYANDISTGFKDKILTLKTSSQSSMKSWASNIKTAFTDSQQGAIYGETFKKYAKYVVEGFNNGINDFYTLSQPYMKMWAKVVKTTFTKALDENSPSKLFEEYGRYTVEGYNIGIEKNMSTTQGLMTKWADSFILTSDTKFAMADTSFSYNSGDISKTMNTDVTSHTTVTATGFKEELEAFYREYMQSTMSQMASDMNRQANKEDKTIVQIGNRTITDAVNIQKRANGYSFTTA